MALTPFYNGLGFLINPWPEAEFGAQFNPIGTTINAVGESCGAAGYLHLPGGPGTSKSFSSSGGRVAVYMNGVTWANAGTTVRIGIQDVSGSTGLEDGTFDVYADLVPGTETMANDINSYAMETGSRTLNHGELIYVGLEMTARGGTDGFNVLNRGSFAGLPYSTVDTGTLTKSTTRPLITLVMDDGTVGWLGYHTWVGKTETPAGFNSGSTPDEYALIFRVPMELRVQTLFANLSGVNATNKDFELILYSDPLGSPAVVEALSFDMDLYPFGENFERPLATPYDLAAATDYAIAVRPTTANAVTFFRVAFGSGNGALRGATLLGTNWYQATRTDQTGAFGSANTTVIPCFGVRVSQIYDAEGDPGSTGGVSRSRFQRRM